MAKLIVILLIALLFEAVGVVVLKQGLNNIGELREISAAEVGRLVRRGATNGYILLGVLMETIFFGLLLFMLKHWDVSLVWPLTSLGFILTTLAAKFVAQEEVSMLRWSGVLLIVAGAVMVGYSERIKTPPLPLERAAEPAVSKE